MPLGNRLTEGLLNAWSIIQNIYFLWIIQAKNRHAPKLLLGDPPKMTSTVVKIKIMPSDKKMRFSDSVNHSTYLE